MYEEINKLWHLVLMDRHPWVCAQYQTVLETTMDCTFVFAFYFDTINVINKSVVAYHVTNLALQGDCAFSWLICLNSSYVVQACRMQITQL